MPYATLQQVRRGYEEPVEAALEPFNVPVYTANRYTDDVANLDEFCYIDLTFRDVIELTLVNQMEYLRGALTIDLFTRKGEGPGRSQTILEAVMRALNGLEQGSQMRVTSMQGPLWVAPSNKPHIRGRLICRIYARPISDDVPPPSQELFPLVTEVGDGIVIETGAPLYVRPGV
jgi:hypothetical protein